MVANFYPSQFVRQCNYETASTTASAFTPTRFYSQYDIQTTSSTGGTYRFDFNTTTTATTQSAWTVGSDFAWRLNVSGSGLFGGKAYELKEALMRIFKAPDEKLWKDLTDDEKKMFKAKKTSEKLLKKWLSTNEWKALKEKGEIEIPAIDEENCIYVVKKDPNEKVIVKKNGHRDHQLCVVAKDLDLPVGDQLLSKIMLVKHNQPKLKEMGVRYD